MKLKYLGGGEFIGVVECVESSEIFIDGNSQ